MAEQPTTKQPSDSEELRRRAERVAARQTGEHGLSPPEDLPAAVHELLVHQIELEMQNEALREAQEALEASRDRYADLYDFAPVGYATLDEQGVITEINLTACRMVGRERRRVLGHSLVSCLAAEQRSRFRDDFDKRRRMVPAAELAAETVLRAPDGRELPVLLAMLVVVDAGSGQRHYRVAITDIADRKRAEAALKELNETLEARVAERTALAERRARDLRRLAAELSEAEDRERRRLALLLHDDVQQLLLAARLRVTVLRRGGAEALEASVQSVDELPADCMRVLQELTQTLRPAVLQRGTPAQAIQWLGAWFSEKHGLAVAVDVSGELPTLPEHLRVFVFQAVRELLFNVVKHSGQLAARVRASWEKGHLTIGVEDDGVGFQPEAVEDRLDNPEGFGLFNIRERLEALGGRLEIGRTPRGGAYFRVIVPVEERPEAGPKDLPLEEVGTARSPRKPRAAERALRLLVVDDHEVVRQGLVELLGRSPDFTVIGQAGDGEEAVAQADALRPDAIIMDIDMPNVDGIEATRRIKRRQADLIVVGLSLHDNEAVRRAMIEAGADACLSKHAAAKDLVATVWRLCR
jgi:PAS domain S-box-containing protein